MTDDGLLPESSRLSVPHYVLSRRLDDETVLLNLDSEQYYGLEGVGSRLWELVEAGTTFGQAVDTLDAEYDVDRRVLLSDLSAVAADLHRNGLLLVNAP